MVYAGLRAINPRATVSATMAAAGAIAFGVECFRLYHQPSLDAFRATLAGRLLLGQFFSLWNIAAYAVGIACVALADRRIARAREHRRRGALDARP
jgi:hypothetical protein